MSETEVSFFNSIRDKSNIIFDVGSYNDSIFVQSDGEVHYFEPYPEYLTQLQQLPNNNQKSFFNCFGLSDENTFFDFWVNSYSFVERPHSTGAPVRCELRRGDEYCKENQIEEIDFLKIDVECMETKVFRGFVDFQYMFFEDYEKLTPIVDRTDLWKWCNIAAYNKNYFNDAPWT